MSENSRRKCWAAPTILSEYEPHAAKEYIFAAILPRRVVSTLSQRTFGLSAKHLHGKSTHKCSPMVASCARVGCPEAMTRQAVQDPRISTKGAPEKRERTAQGGHLLPESSWGHTEGLRGHT